MLSVYGMQLLVYRLQLLVGALQLFVAGDKLLVALLHFLLLSFVYKMSEWLLQEFSNRDTQDLFYIFTGLHNGKGVVLKHK